MYFCLLIALLWIGGCTHFQSKVKEVEESAGEPSFCRNNFFQEKNGKEVVPFCPVSEGLVLLPATFPPAQIFLGYVPQPSHVQFLRDLLDKLVEDSHRPQVIVTVPRHENDEAYRLFKKYLEPPYSSFVRFLSMPSDDSLWTQDYFEVGISTVSGRGTFVDLPSQGLESESIPASLALSCQMGLVQPENVIDQKKLKGQSDFGGNIEAFPGNFLVVGDHLSSSAQDLLEVNLSQDILRVNTSWGEPGQIDEMFTVLPDLQNNQGHCGFSILYSSPELALKILREQGLESKRSRLSPPIPEGEESIPVIERVDFSECYGLLKDEAYKNSSSKVRQKCEELLKANSAYAKSINESLGQIIESIEKRTNCSAIKSIPMPVLYGPEKIKGQYGTKEDYAMNVNPNPINLISLGQVVVLAKQAYPPFDEYVLEKIKSLGLDVHSIDGSYVHYLRGGIHSTSNVVRMCRPPDSDK